MKTKMLVAFCICLGLISDRIYAQSRPTAEEKFVIDDYSFEWTVFKIGKAKISIEKTQDATRVRVSSDSDSMSLSPADAESVAAVLQGADAYYNKLRGSTKDVSESATVGDCKVMFMQSPKFGFLVHLSDSNRFLSGISLDRKTAIAIAPQLKKSVVMSKHVDRLIDTALSAK